MGRTRPITLKANPQGVSMIETHINNQTGILSISLNRPKVNAQNRTLLEALASAFEKASTDTQVKGILFKAEGKCFSAGLDLQEVLSFTEPELVDFMKLFDRAYGAVYLCPKPVAVAVNGHAIAGGAILTLMCDYIAFGRNPGKFGVTELAVGVPFPKIAFDAVYAALPLRARRKMIYTAALFNLSEVYDLGIGDSLTEHPEQDALNWLMKVTSFPLATFTHTKNQWRAKNQAIASNQCPQEHSIEEILTSDAVQNTLKSALR
jgi:enoyl-CoA hydratase